MLTPSEYNQLTMHRLLLFQTYRRRQLEFQVYEHWHREMHQQPDESMRLLPSNQTTQIT